MLYRICSKDNASREQNKMNSFIFMPRRSLSSLFEAKIMQKNEECVQNRENNIANDDLNDFC